MSNHLIDIPPSRLRGCYFCAERLDSNGAGTFARAHGWVRVSRKRGINALALPELLDYYACTECIDKLKHGIAIGQQSLFGHEPDGRF